MIETEKIVTEKKPSKKETRKEVFEKLSGALAEYKSNLNGKKFKTKLKKASKLFATEIVKSIKKDRNNGHAKKITEVK